MPPLLTHIWFLLGEMLRAPFDAVLGRARRTYTVSMSVAAPKSVTWAVASAHTIRLEGTPPIEIETLPDPARPGVYTGKLRIGELNLPMAYRVLDERPGEAMSLEIIKEESAPECCPGDDYVCALAVTGNEEGSAITSNYQLTHTRFTSRLLVPFAAIQNIWRLKNNAELRAGTKATSSSMVKNALLTGALTFASFYALFGLSHAAMLIVLIFIHELGHVIAMRWTGLPVKGIYFVPFFGGVAVSAELYRDEGQRGLVALMGPGFSLLTTVAFMWLASINGDASLRELTMMSAALNGFNLLPMMPLDGGHVMQSLMSRLSASSVRIFNIAALGAGVMLALFIGSYTLLAVLLLISPAIAADPAGRIRLPPLTQGQTVLLLMAYLATFVFYMSVFAASFDTFTSTAPQEQALLQPGSL